MKKIVIGILTLVMLLGMVTFADEIATLLNIDTLKEEAVSNSLTLQSSALALENRVLDLEQVDKDAFNANQIGGDRVTYINNRIKVESDTLIAKHDVELATLKLAKDEIDLKNSITIKSMNYLLLLDKITLNEKLLEFKELYKKYVEQKVATGISTNIDLTNKIIEIQSHENLLLELKANVESSKIEINHLIGKDLNSDLVISDTIKIIDYRKFDIEKIYEERVAKYPAVYTKAEMLKSKEIIFGLYDEKYVEKDKEHKKAKNDMLIAEVEYKDALKDFEVALRSSYNAYLNAHDTYLLSLKQSELSMKLYNDIKLKFDLGVANQEQLLQAEEAKLNAEFAITQAIYSYNLTRLDFDSLY